jgi:magnesium transporter
MSPKENSLKPTLGMAELQDPVTKHMRGDFIRLQVDLTVGEALEQLLIQQPEGRILYLYACDAQGVLHGVIPTRRLLLNPRHVLLRDIMISRVITIPPTATVFDACEFFTLHKLLAFPVVDEHKRMIGIVDVDLYTNELHDIEHRQENDALFQLIGVHRELPKDESLFSPFRRRFPWLLANIAGGIAAAFLTGLFEAELRTVVELALFIPVVLALAESVAIQSVSLSLERASKPRWGDLLRKVALESFTGGLLGLACGGVVAFVAILWLGKALLALAVFGGVMSGVLLAAVFGVAIPKLLRLLRLDPQVASGPIALAAADMATLVLYFNLARWLLSL